MKKIIFVFLFLFSVCAFSQQIPDTSRVHNRTEKFFDLDKSGNISAYERGLVNTHQRTHWKLARSRSQRKYDRNGDHMLDPFEENAYRKARKRNGIASAPIEFLEKFNATLRQRQLSP